MENQTPAASIPVSHRYITVLIDEDFMLCYIIFWFCGDTQIFVCKTYMGMFEVYYVTSNRL